MFGFRKKRKQQTGVEVVADILIRLLSMKYSDPVPCKHGRTECIAHQERSGLFVALIRKTFSSFTRAIVPTEPMIE